MPVSNSLKTALGSFNEAGGDFAGVQNTYYTILETAAFIEVDWIYIFQLNTETAAKNLMLRVTIDGTVLTGTDVACNNGTGYFWYIGINGGTGALDVVNSTSFTLTPQMRGRSVKIEVRSTSAPGTAQHIYTQIVFHKY